jgi:beta-lactamase regulating signal transducer with metallopeptidase domain
MALFYVDEVLQQIGPAVVEGLAQGVLRGTLCLAVAGIIAISLHKRTSPAVRHMIWTLGVIALLLAPLGIFLTPSYHVLPDWSEPMRDQIVQAVHPPPALPQVLSPAPTSPRAQGDPIQPEVSFPSLQEGQIRPSEGPTIEGAPRQVIKLQSPPLALTNPLDLWATAAAVPANPQPSPYKSALALLWLAGFSLCITPVVIGYAAMLAARLKYRRVTEGPWHDLLNSLRKQLHIKRPVSLIRSKRGGMPMTWGIFFAQVVLPEDSFGWSPERKRIVILHELAHIRRWDTLTQLLAQIACAIFWFNPMVWFAASRMRIERELACDDLVLRAGCRPSDYAEELLSIATGVQTGDTQHRLSAALGVPMARTHKIESRVRSILDLGRRPGAITRLGLLTAVVAASIILVPGMVLRAKSSTQIPSPGQFVSSAATWLQRAITAPAQSPKQNSEASLSGKTPTPAEPELLSPGVLASSGRPDPGASLPETDPPVRAPKTTATPDINPETQKIQKQLNTAVASLNITDHPLDQTLRDIANRAQLTFDIDWEALAANGVLPDMPINYLGQNVTHADVLQAVLTQAGSPISRAGPGAKTLPGANRPVYAIQGNVVRIAPRRLLLANGPTRDYELRDLLKVKDTQGQALWNADTLLARFKEAGEPGDWDIPASGVAAFSDIRLNANRVTVIAPQETHDRIRKTLAALAYNARVAANPTYGKPAPNPGISDQPVPQSIDLDPAKTLILNNSGNWNEVGWLNGAMAVSARKSSEQVWRFDIADPGGAETWYRHVTAPAFVKNYPFLVVRYRATGLAPSGPYGIWMDDGVGPNMGGYSPLATNHFIADGTVREVRADLRLTPRSKPNPGPLAGSLALGVHAAPGSRATFEILQIRWEADPATPNPSVSLDHAAVFNVIDDQGKPLQGVTIRAMADYQNLSTSADTDTSGAASVFYARPDTLGHYTRPNRDKSEQTPGMLVQLTKEGYGSRLYRVPFPFSARTTLRLDPVASARGRVLDVDQNPVEGAGVVIEAQNTKTNQISQRTAITDKLGQWATDPFPIGQDWNLTAVRALDLRYLPQEYLTKEQHGKLSAKELCAQETTIVVHNGITLTGRISDPDGKNIPGATVECEFMSGSIRSSLDASTDATGRYAIGPVAPGQARLVFRGSGYQPAAQTVYVPGKPAQQSVNAVLAKATPIRGHLVDRYGKPIAGAWVRVRISQNGPATFDGRTSATGQFTYPNAPDKICKIDIILEEGLPFYVVEMSPDPRVQTVTLYSGHAAVEPLTPRVSNDTSYRIRGINPTEALRRDLDETFGMRNIYSSTLPPNSNPGDRGMDWGAIHRHATP